MWISFPVFLQGPSQAGPKLDSIGILLHVGDVIDRRGLVIRGGGGVAYEARFTVGLVYRGNVGDF